MSASGPSGPLVVIFQGGGGGGEGVGTPSPPSGSAHVCHILRHFIWVCGCLSEQLFRGFRSTKDLYLIFFLL